MLAITAANGITFLSASTFEKIHRLNDSFESCRFDAKNRLWTWARFSTATGIVEVWEPGTWRKIAKTKIHIAILISGSHLIRIRTAWSQPRRAEPATAYSGLAWGTTGLA
jgi:hypothetical protein